MRFLLTLALILPFGLLPGQYSPPGTCTIDYSWSDSNAVCEYLFLGTLTFIQPNLRKSTNLMLDKKGDVAWYNQSIENMLDFKVHPSGYFSFYTMGEFYILDSAFNLVDQLRCTGRPTDLHDIIITENGGYFLICTEDSTMDLSGLTTIFGNPGSTNGTVIATVIQELDSMKNVVREWHAFPHFDLLDIDTNYFSNPNSIELNHTNSIDLDDQGRMMMSHRANHEVTLIDWTTGDVLWRLGGENNQFNFTNDIGISAQHDARRLPDGRVSLFDNGTFHDPPRGRGLIYDLDTAAMTATMDWEYTDTLIHSTAMGSFRVLPNGDGLVNFGVFGPSSRSGIRFVKANGNEVLNIKLEDDHWTYRAQCLSLPFELQRPQIICSEQGGQVTLSLANSHTQYIWNNGETTADIIVTDTGRYQVFVPHGIGFIGSEVLHITNLGAPCPPVGKPEAQSGGRPPKLLKVYDIFGRTVDIRRAGELYIELYDDGSTRKVITSGD